MATEAAVRTAKKEHFCFEKLQWQDITVRVNASQSSPVSAGGRRAAHLQKPQARLLI